MRPGSVRGTHGEGAGATPAGAGAVVVAPPIVAPPTGADAAVVDPPIVPPGLVGMVAPFTGAVAGFALAGVVELGLTGAVVGLALGVDDGAVGADGAGVDGGPVGAGAGADAACARERAPQVIQACIPSLPSLSRRLCMTCQSCNL
jgi:hypothetical protein